MNKILLTMAGLLATSPAAHAAEKSGEPTVRVCAAWINGRASHCVEGTQSHTLPGNTLYGVSEGAEGAPVVAYTHSWNGAAPDRMVSQAKGRVLVSQLRGGPGEGKSVTFKVTAPDGAVIATRELDVRWQDKKMVAQGIDPNKPLVPEAVADPEKPVPARTATTTESPLASTGGMMSQFALRRGELQAGYLWEKSGSSALSIIPTWNPEFRWRPEVGFGARVGGTFWADRNNESFLAFEGDLHATIPFK
ncbi:MAG: hypothetical protein EOP11_07995, partial [Proteobacteria bacterium]